MHPVLALALLAALSAPSPPDAPLTFEVRVLVGNFVPGAQPDGNTVVFLAPGGLVVVDTGRHEAHTQRVLDLARRLGTPVAVVVNTHWHLDHVSGNPIIRRAFPAVEVVGSRAIDEALAGFPGDIPEPARGRDREDRGPGGAKSLHGRGGPDRRRARTRSGPRDRGRRARSAGRPIGGGGAGATRRHRRGRLGVRPRVRHPRRGRPRHPARAAARHGLPAGLEGRAGADSRGSLSCCWFPATGGP